MIRSVAAGAHLFSLMACAPTGPDAALDAYARALETGDAARIHSLSDPATQDAVDPEALARFMAKNPATVRRAADALRGREAVREERTVRVLASGHRLELVRCEDRWCVAESPLPIPRFDTPEHALETFFFAARGHLSLLRQSMPAEARARFASDASLARHLGGLLPRVEAARAALEPLAPGRARIDGDEASIPWDQGKAVRLVREDGGWRVLDLE